MGYSKNNNHYEEPNGPVTKTTDSIEHPYEDLHKEKRDESPHKRQDKAQPEAAVCCKLDRKTWIIFALVALLVIGTITATVIILQLQQDNDTKNEGTSKTKGK